MNINTLSPIVLFVYNRPDHTRQTIDALAANTYAKDSELFIFSDAPLNETAADMVQSVRTLIHEIKESKAFKSVTIVERDINWGLAKSIIDGVTTIAAQYGKIIVLEDDIVTSPYFLQFMNEALDFYENEKKVWHITGYSYPIDTSRLPDTYFTKSLSCWGWATWIDRWNFFEKNTEKLFAVFTKKMKKDFNVGKGNYYWRQIKANQTGKVNTWAIYWYATIYLNNGLCLNPKLSFVQNIGMDGTGVHCGIRNDFSNKILNFNNHFIFDSPLEESYAARMQIQKFLYAQPRFIQIIVSIVKGIQQLGFLPTFLYCWNKISKKHLK